MLLMISFVFSISSLFSLLPLCFYGILYPRIKFLSILSSELISWSYAYEYRSIIDYSCSSSESQESESLSICSLRIFIGYTLLGKALVFEDKKLSNLIFYGSSPSSDA